MQELLLKRFYIQLLQTVLQTTTVLRIILTLSRTILYLLLRARQVHA